MDASDLVSTTRARNPYLVLLYRVSKNTDNAYNVVQDDKLIINQGGTPVRKRTVWAL